VRPAAALEQRPFEELSPRFRTKENHFVSKSAGEICASRHNPASYLITLPRAIIQFSFVLPSRFRSQIFSVEITSLRIEHDNAERSLIILNVDFVRFVAIRCQGSGGVEELKPSNVAEIIVETVVFWLSYYFRQISRQAVFLARNLGERALARVWPISGAGRPREMISVPKRR
jgi:hypothetical protein